MTDRRRNTFVLLIVLGLVILSLLVIVGIPGVVKAKKTRLGLDLKGGVELTYQARPTAQSKVDCRIAGPRDRHHAQARRSAGRRRAGNPAHGP